MNALESQIMIDITEWAERHGITIPETAAIDAMKRIAELHTRVEAAEHQALEWVRLQGNLAQAENEVAALQRERSELLAAAAKVQKLNSEVGEEMPLLREDIERLMHERDQARAGIPETPAPAALDKPEEWTVIGNTLYIGPGPNDWIAFPGDAETAHRIADAYNRSIRLWAQLTDMLIEEQRIYQAAFERQRDQATGWKRLYDAASRNSDDEEYGELRKVADQAEMQWFTLHYDLMIAHSHVHALNDAIWDHTVANWGKRTAEEMQAINQQLHRQVKEIAEQKVKEMAERRNKTSD